MLSQRSPLAHLRRSPTSPCINPLVTIPRAPITIGITIKVQVLIVLFAFFPSYLVVSRNSKVLNSTSSLFVVVYNLDWLSGWDEVSSLYLKIPEEFVRLILLDRFRDVYILFFRTVKFQFLAQFPVDHFTHPVVSFYASLLQSLIIWLTISSLSPHNLHLLFCCVLSILVLIWLVLMALFWAAIRRHSVSLLRFTFFLATSMVYRVRLKCP